MPASYFDRNLIKSVHLCLYWLKLLTGRAAVYYNKRGSANIKKAYKHIGAFQVVHSCDIVPQACGNLLYITCKPWVKETSEKGLSQGSQVSRNRCAESYCQRPSRYTSTSISIISPSPRVLCHCWSSQSAASADLKSPVPLPLRPSCFPFFWGVWTEGEDTVEVGSWWVCRIKSSLKTESIWRQTSCNVKVKKYGWERKQGGKCPFSLLFYFRTSSKSVRCSWQWLITLHSNLLNITQIFVSRKPRLWVSCYR